MSQMLNCVQCGRTFNFPQGGSNAGSPASPVWCCSGGCVDAYNRQHGLGKYNPVSTAVLGLAGKAIGGAVSGAKERKQEQAQQKAYDAEQRRAEREERNRQDAEEKAAASAARHVITHEVMCPICDTKISASMASDGETKIRCQQCKTRLRVDYDGDITVLGPQNERLTKAESLDINEDRICSGCKHYLSSGERTKKYWIRWPAIIGGIYLVGCTIGWGMIWKIGGAILLGLVFICMIIYRFVLESGFISFCKNQEARSVTELCSFETPERNINPNLRCKFWEKK